MAARLPRVQRAPRVSGGSAPRDELPPLTREARCVVAVHRAPQYPFHILAHAAFRRPHMSLFVLCAVLLGPAVASAADFNMDVKADGITLGDHLMGPKVSPGDLKGHVVVLEFWGINCGPCLAAMPHIAKLNDDLGGAGLIVIGAH